MPPVIFKSNIPNYMKFVMPVTESGCWIWMGRTMPTGYGQLSYMGHPRYAHRVFYKLLRGEIPPGLHIDHLCRVRCCVNPDHLEPVTHKENAMRGIGFGPINAKKTHCPRGHEYSKENTYYGSYGYRWCKQCMAMHARNRRVSR